MSSPHETDQTERRLQELGHRLPSAPAPLAAYRPATQHGVLIYTSGQLPFHEGGLYSQGHVGLAGPTNQAVGVEQARVAAQHCLLNALAAVKQLTGSLDRVERVVKVTGYVASAAHFFEQPRVVDGASQLLVDLWGQQGHHARSAVGVSALPCNATVELELVVAVEAGERCSC